MITTHRSRYVWPILIILGFIVYICAFKVMDRDFWWHVKAGEIMVHTHRLIQTEPFAYTRAGQPYTSTHEWLAQIALYLIYHFSGATGIILFRTVMMALTFLILLSINPASLWINGLIAIWAANVVRGGFMDRPQLFTFVIFAAFLKLACRYLELPAEEILPRRRILATFVLLQILWVNLHGAACMMGFLVVGALFAEELLAGYEQAGRRLVPEMVMPARDTRWTLMALGVAFFISPNSYHNLTYLLNLLTDKTIAFIGEWQPRPLHFYLIEIGPFWVLGLLAIAAHRRHWLFNSLVFVATGLLSLKALRQEMIFVLAATALLFFQLKYWTAYQGALERLRSRRGLAAAGYLLVLALLGAYTRKQYFLFGQKDQLYGYGTYDLARGAYDFLDREHVQGHMFNTYGIGGYLLYRGYPNRQVYIDGRNVDYGFDYMYRTYFAGEHADLWQILEDHYGFTVAVIDYNEIKKTSNDIPYIMHLEKNPHWKLVFVDDWVAIYLKDTPENQPIIARHEFHMLTPGHLDERGWAWTVPQTDFPMLEAELLRSVNENRQGVKARLMLANLYLRAGAFDWARKLIDEALKEQPFKPEIYEVRAALAVQQKQWAQAGKDYDQMVQLAGPSYGNINYKAITEVFAAAGNASKTKEYARKAGVKVEVEAAPPAVSTEPARNVESQSPQETQKQAQKLLAELTAPPSDSARRHNDRGVDEAHAGRLDSARKEFEAALATDPAFQDALNNLGSVEYQERHWDAAIADYIKALEINPSYRDARRNLAHAYYHAGKYDKARQEAESAQKQGTDMAALLKKIDLASGH